VPITSFNICFGYPQMTYGLESSSTLPEHSPNTRTRTIDGGNANSMQARRPRRAPRSLSYR